MADVLFLLDALDQQEKERGRQQGRKTPRRTPIPKSRPTSLPKPSPSIVVDPPVATPRTSDYAASTYSRHSTGTDSRRISFVELPRPAARRLRIPTRSDNLASGFPHDPKLLKYNVTPPEWEKFSSEVVEAANVPGPSWMWRFNRKDVIARLKKELQYDGDFKRIFKRWNKEFRRRGFEANLELPVVKGDKPYGRQVADDASKEEKMEVKREMRRFRMVISPVERGSGGSIYSRSSSLTRSVTGEGRRVSASSGGLAAGVQAAFDQAKEAEEEVRGQNSESDPEDDSEGGSDGDRKPQGAGPDTPANASPLAGPDSPTEAFPTFDAKDGSKDGAT